MIWFAPTLPADLYPRLDTGLSHYHLAQAHHLVYASNEVLDWFKARDCKSNHFVILDNGVMELGEPNMDALKDVAEVVKPSAVICPDAFRDHLKTMQLFNQHFETCTKLAPYVMIVPQGASVGEWCYCASKMLTELREVDVFGRPIERVLIGVPKSLEAYPGGRHAALAWLSTQVPRVSAHLLGLWAGMEEAVNLLQAFPRTDFIMGLDSTLPYAHALHGEVTASMPQHPFVITNAKRSLSDKDWTAIQRTDLSEETLMLAEVNIAIVRHLLKDKV